MIAQSFDAWLGRHEVCIDQINAAPLRRLAAVLDHRDPPWRKNELPPLGHWLYHLNHSLQSELGSDGHPTGGGISPSVSEQRRMWAGSRVNFLRPVSIGETAVRRSTVAHIATKTGSSGEMLLVTIRHEILCGNQVAIEEEQDIAYVGERAQPLDVRSPITMAVRKPQVTRTVHATPELLFRFSALTFNAHRIHYDREYARNTEHYPGLVVQGPLLATFLIDLLLRNQPGLVITRFGCRALAPVFESQSFTMCSATRPHGEDLWVLGSRGELKMTAQIETHGSKKLAGVSDEQSHSSTTSQ